jgi:formylmethanofuran dehydrogenase subunit C
MAIEITTRFVPPFPVELPPLNYSAIFRGQPNDLADLGRLPIALGKDVLQFADLFHCQPVGEHPLVVFQGATHQLQSVARKLESGTVRVEGAVGDFAGADMRGGRLEIRGAAGHWLAADCRGGVIAVAGDCGRSAAAARPGRRRGIIGGMIMVQGSAESGAGRRMRRGVVVIGGDTCELAPEMLAGTMIVGGRVSGTVGHLMKRGTLVCLQPLEPVQTLNMQRGIATNPLVWRLLVNHLARHGHTALASYRAAQLQTYHLDRLTGLRGELWVATSELDGDE